jgi:phage shock protein PspC (stress-responsive transcriptional regulator)
MDTETGAPARTLPEDAARVSRRRSRARMRFARSRRDVVLTGVAAGFAERAGVDPMIVRVAFVVLTVAGGVGIVAYLGAWAASLDPGHPGAPEPRPPTTQQALAFGAITGGGTLVLRSGGLWLGDAIGIPVLLAAVGAGVLYARGTDDGAGTRRSGAPVELPKPAAWRIVVGAVLVIGGVAAFLAATESFAAMWTAGIAVAVTVAGLAVVFGPWMWRIVNQLAEERRDRIRSEEREEVAAHLHDSVLQTLAMIQRNADNPRTMATLARRQERELRTWLYGGPSTDGERLEPAVQAAAAQVEDAHDVLVEAVVVGDCDLDDRARALVQACREAMHNAALHSGAASIDVYVECEPDRITAFVRDRGTGFDPAAVPDDRRGIADSIRGRLGRHGGRAEISSVRGEGTEVQLTVGRERM